MKKRKRSSFATHDGKLYVLLKHSGIPALIVLCDGLSVVFFDDDKKRNYAYLRAEDWLRWYETEAKHCTKRAAQLPGVRKTIELFAAGKVKTAT